jgi:hypothetical protein
MTPAPDATLHSRSTEDLQQLDNVGRHGRPGQWIAGNRAAIRELLGDTPVASLRGHRTSLLRHGLRVGAGGRADGK